MSKERIIAGVRIVELTTPHLRVPASFMGNMKISRIDPAAVGVLPVTNSDPLDITTTDYEVQGEHAAQRFLSAVASGISRFACQVIE